MIRALLILAGICLASQTAALECRDLAHDGNRYSVCEADLTKDELRLFLNDESGQLLGQFSTVNSALKTEGKQLAFAMNAGMYHDDRSPVGHYVENGIEQKRVIPNAVPATSVCCPMAYSAFVQIGRMFLKPFPSSRSSRVAALPPNPVRCWS